MLRHLPQLSSKLLRDRAGSLLQAKIFTRGIIIFPLPVLAHTPLLPADYVGHFWALEFVVIFQITRHSGCPDTAEMLLAGSSFSILHAALALVTGSSTSRVHHLVVVRTARHRTGTTASLPTPPPLSSDLETSKDAAAAARDWLMRFKGCPIPRAAVEIAFSRSSGPGGQVCLSTIIFVQSKKRGAMANRTSTR